MTRARNLLVLSTITLIAIAMVVVPVRAQGSPTEFLTVHQAVVHCRTPSGGPGPDWPIMIYGYYVTSTHTSTGYLLSTPGRYPTTAQARGQAVSVEGGHSLRPPLPGRGWLEVLGALTCPSQRADIVASRWERASATPPVPQVYLSVIPPRVLRVGDDAGFQVSVHFGTSAPLAAYYVDFLPTGGWARPHVRTPDGSQACGGDNIPAQPTRSRGYWRLDFGDCRTIILVLRPTVPGRHSLTIRPFWAPVDDRGIPLLARRVLERRHEYVWRGTVAR